MSANFFFVIFLSVWGNDTLNLDCTRAYIFKNSSNLRIIYGRSLWIYFTVIDGKYSSVTTSLLSFSNWFNDSLTIIPTSM